MDKIVGKHYTLIIMFCIFASCVVRAELQLRVVDLRGKPCTQVAAGTPFKVEVTLDGDDRSVRPTVRGLAQGRVEGTQMHMTSVNGVTNLQYSYRVTLDNPGTYTFGPATLKGQQTKSVQVEVIPKAVAQPQEEKQTPIFLRLVCNKTRATVGEKVGCSLQCYYRDGEVQVQQLIKPDPENCDVSEVEGPTVSVQTVDGEQYQCAVLEWEITPKAPGKIIMPPCTAHYGQVEQQDFFGGFMSHFQRLVNKRIFSNQATITVENLPAHNGPVHAIGRFKKFTASLTPAIAKVGEGVVLKLEVEGEGDLDDIKTPELQNIPVACKCYDSKNYTVEESDESEPSAHCFEYIVQCMQAGQWEIGKQQFTYFDTKTRSYKTLESGPVQVNVVTPASANQQEPHDSTQKIDASDSDEPSEVDENHGGIKSLHQGSYFPRHEQEIPFWLFILFIALPITTVAGLYAMSKLGGGRRQLSPARKKKLAFERANKKLQAAQQLNAQAQIYPIFIELLSEMYTINGADLSHDEIAALLAQSGIDEDALTAWNEFFARTTESVFGRKNEHEYDNLFAQAQHWLKVLEKKL